jgi:uncharacterized protein YndB with AHSA1/START domain
MPTASRSVTVDRPIDKVARYLSDFSTTAEWDPHTASCRRLDSGPLGVGARFENVQRLAGHDSTLTYEVTEYEPGRRIVLEGGNDTVRTRDEMTFVESAPGVTTVTYTVEVHLLGAAKLGELLVPAVMKKVADDGEDGMRERLLRL